MNDGAPRIDPALPRCARLRLITYELAELDARAAAAAEVEQISGATPWNPRRF